MLCVVCYVVAFLNVCLALLSPLSHACFTCFQGTPYGDRQWECLRACAAANTESLGRLLLEFLWKYAFGLDTRRHVVTVRNKGPVVHKDDKAMTSPWTTKPFLRYAIVGWWHMVWLLRR